MLLKRQVYYIESDGKSLQFQWILMKVRICNYLY